MVRRISLRDPAGYLIRDGGRLLRVVTLDGVPNARACLDSEVVKRWQAAGGFISVDELNDSDAARAIHSVSAAMVLEHREIFFPTFPCEWSLAMLRAAGHCTLDLAVELLNENRGLKDATPFNIIFDGARPVFVDALSVEDRDPKNPTWHAYGQFVRTFILPAVAARHLGWSLRRAFTGSRDGLVPEQLHRMLSWRDRLRPGVFGFVSGPTLIARMSRARYTARQVDQDAAKFAVRSILAHLRRALDRATKYAYSSEWTGYRDPDVHAATYHDNRLALVTELLHRFRPATVLDVGTNDGAFAEVAALSGAKVVAIDRDEAVVDSAFRREQRPGDRITYGVVDLTDPTPAAGWRNSERPSFLDRARNGFDCVLCLSVLHHLVIGDWLPITEVVELLATLAKSVLIAEFVPPDDPYCVDLAAGRPIDHSRWSEAAFESAMSVHFTIIERHPVGDGGRTVMVLKRHGS
jgi:hypothetical protein